MVSELAAIYYSFVRPRPFLAGLFFAFAFGNRTEVILTVPVFIFAVLRNGDPDFRSRLRAMTRFCAIPFLLGIATLLYNSARFGSPFDFGLASLPGVLEEPWYRHGIFSIYAIPANAWQMLLEPWHRITRPPYFLPDGFGGSIFLNAPFLICIFQTGARHRDLKAASWIAITLLTAVFWCHGNTGGWQFSYRGAIVMLPWFFLLLLEATQKRLRKWQLTLIAVSILINGWATYLFLWTNWIQP
jgi:Gpi18-like mannosyltransferase